VLPEKLAIGAWELTRRGGASQAECLTDGYSDLALANALRPGDLA